MLCENQITCEKRSFLVELFGNFYYWHFIKFANSIEKLSFIILSLGSTRGNKKGHNQPNHEGKMNGDQPTPPTSYECMHLLCMQNWGTQWTRKISSNE